MNEESVRQDKELARAAIKGLTSYAEQIAHKGKDDEIQQVRSLVDALSLYWEWMKKGIGLGNSMKRCSRPGRKGTYRGAGSA